MQIGVLNRGVTHAVAKDPSGFLRQVCVAGPAWIPAIVATLAARSGLGGGEIKLDVVVVDGRSGLPAPAATAMHGRDDASLATQGVDSVAIRRQPLGFKFVRDEPVSELGVVGVWADREF